MTNVLITGAGGFLGRRLARVIAAGAPLPGTDGGKGPASRLELVDLTAPEPPAGAAMPVACTAADAVRDLDALIGRRILHFRSDFPCDLVLLLLL